MGKKWFLPILLIVALSAVIAGCGGGGSSSNDPVAPTDDQLIRNLMISTESAFLKQTEAGKCFTESVDCGNLEDPQFKNPQGVVDRLAGSSPESALVKFTFRVDGITGSEDTRTVNFVIYYNWADDGMLDPPVVDPRDTDPLSLKVTKTANGWRISDFSNVIGWFWHRTYEQMKLSQKFVR